VRDLAESERALLPPGKRGKVAPRGGVRRRRDGAAVRPSAADRGGALKPSDLSIEERILRLERKNQGLQQKLFQQGMTIEALVLCLQAAAELGQIEFDLALLKSASAKAKEFVKRGAESKQAGEAGEFAGVGCGEVMGLRFGEFWDENFSE